MKLIRILFFGLFLQLNLSANAEKIDDLVKEAGEKDINMVLKIEKLNCKFGAKVVGLCLNDFSEIKSFDADFKEHLVSIKLSANARLFEILSCLKDEGYEAKIKAIR